MSDLICLRICMYGTSLNGHKTQINKGVIKSRNKNTKEKVNAIK